MLRHDYSLTVDRDEVWRGALIFNKKASTNSDILRKNLTIFFKGQDGLDAGAAKADSFEILLQELQQRLFKGSEWSMLPELQRPKQPRNKQPNEQAAKVQVLCLTGHLVYK